MPPKAKFTREEIIEVALKIVRKEGFGELTARSLGAMLGSSARPVFTVFCNMEDVQNEVIAAARGLYSEYVKEGLSRADMPAFKGVGLSYILFAVEEPKLFQILFMSERQLKPDVMSALPVIDDNFDEILASVQKSFSLSLSDSEWLYRHLWIYTHGIAVLLSTNMCSFTGEEIDVMLTEVCMAMLREKKEGKKND